MKKSIKNGQRFGKLTVLDYTDRKDHKGEYKCLCDCGNITYARTSSLKSGKHLSCCGNKGPRLKARKLNSESSKNRTFSNYKRAASKRGYEFNLTKEEFIDIITRNCVYCNTPPSMLSVGNSTWIDIFKHNGIDRVDNSIGYTSENSVSCCKICNNAKSTLSLKEWFNWLKTILNFNFKNLQRLSERSTFKRMEMEDILNKDEDIVLSLSKDKAA